MLTGGNMQLKGANDSEAEAASGEELNEPSKGGTIAEPSIG